ncbi:MAG: hypothetical protein QHH15_04580 [Candidatus Thermoplasmatota archaeon]|jgi:hypothetical protein|nr:hypothetical protein [Candidatus Thermoplasmatota archaeon]
MAKNKDLIQILSIVIVGMLIPFLGSIIITFNLDITDTSNILKIIFAFVYFLVFFGIELVIVFLYYQITNKIASKKIDKYKPK